MAGCAQCGSCCKRYGMRLDATPLDLARWTLEGRQDILSRVKIEHDGPDASGGLLWVERDGSRSAQCPFLELRADGKYYCGIHEAKPEVCSTHYCQKYLE